MSCSFKVCSCLLAHVAPLGRDSLLDRGHPIHGLQPAVMHCLLAGKHLECLFMLMGGDAPFTACVLWSQVGKVTTASSAAVGADEKRFLIKQSRVMEDAGTTPTCGRDPAFPVFFHVDVG